MVVGIIGIYVINTKQNHFKTMSKGRIVDDSDGKDAFCEEERNKSTVELRVMVGSLFTFDNCVEKLMNGGERLDRQLLAGIVTIACALQWPSAWALVWGGVLGAVAKLAISHAASGGLRPRFGWEPAARGLLDDANDGHSEIDDERASDGRREKREERREERRRRRREERREKREERREKREGEKQKNREERNRQKRIETRREKGEGRTKEKMMKR